MQGSRNSKALVISELLASACSASDPLDRSVMDMKPAQGSRSSESAVTYRLAAARTWFSP